MRRPRYRGLLPAGPSLSPAKLQVSKTPVYVLAFNVVEQTHVAVLWQRSYARPMTSQNDLTWMYSGRPAGPASGWPAL